jgi:hypothetical protein
MFLPTIIVILFFIVVTIKIGPDFSLRTKAVFRFKVKALKIESDFD